MGGVAVQLEHADLFGLTVHSKIEQQSSSLEVNVVLHVMTVHIL